MERVDSMGRADLTVIMSALFFYKAAALSDRLSSLTDQVNRLSCEVIKLCSDTSGGWTPEARGRSTAPHWLEIATEAGRLDIRVVSIIARIYTLQESLETANCEARQLYHHHRSHTSALRAAQAADRTFAGGELSDSFLPDLVKAQASIVKDLTHITRLLGILEAS